MGLPPHPICCGASGHLHYMDSTLICRMFDKLRSPRMIANASMDTDLQEFDELLASTSALREDELADYLASVLSGIDHAAPGTYRSNSGIFWALTRVFGCYDRVVAACEEYSASRADELTFVAALEIEHFLMRLRVLLDEVAYVIRIRLPKAVRGLGQPEGPRSDAVQAIQHQQIGQVC